jgi:hypothetical protein
MLEGHDSQVTTSKSRCVNRKKYRKFNLVFKLQSQGGGDDQ